MTPVTRTHADRCPGVLRPWIADDGAIVRLRLVGGVLPTTALRAVADIAEQFADGTILLTKRTNLQLRGIAHDEGTVPDALVEAVTASGLLPSRTHELIRNIMMSPLTGRSGGRIDLRPVAHELDRLLCAEPDLAGLAGRFLFVLDDGRGDVGGRPLDLGLMAVDDSHVQLRVGASWGPVIELSAAAETLVAYAGHFLAAAADTATEDATSPDHTAPDHTAPWHVDELPGGGSSLIGAHFARDARTQVVSLPVPHGIIETDDGRRIEHLAVPGGVLDRALVDQVLGRAGTEVVVTPWRSLLIPDPALDLEGPA